MPEKISWALDVQVSGGPRISKSSTETVQAYDKVEVVIKGGDQDKKVDVQPAGDIKQIKFLMISSNLYGSELTYSVNAAETDETKRIKLDAPQQLFIGEGSVKLLGGTGAPQSLFFYNDLGLTPAKDTSITILVGRDALA